MTPLVRRFLQEYARTGVNLLLLVTLPVVFVLVASDALAEAAAVLGPGSPSSVTVATAAWAAAYISGVSAYFQVSSARRTDRRLVAAGMPAPTVTAARMTTSALLALAAAAVSLLALAARGDLHHPLRVVTGVVVAAGIYLAIGAVVGAVVTEPVNGVVVLLLVWILDVFFGPVMNPAASPALRLLPTHDLTRFLTSPEWTGTDAASSLATLIIGLLAACLVTARTVRVAGPRPVSTAHPTTDRTRHPPAVAAPPPPPRVTPASAAAASAGPPRRPPRGPWATATRLGLHAQSRQPLLWALLALVPTVFVLLAVAVTPDRPITVFLDPERHSLRVMSMVDLHGGTMAPIAVATLAAVVGLSAVADNGRTDRRLAALPAMAWRALGARATVVAVSAGVAVLAALAATFAVFHPRQPLTYVAATIVTAAVYGLMGMILGALAGRVGGVLLAFLLPFLDLGLLQSPMLHAWPPMWARLLPGYGPQRLIVEASVGDGVGGWPPLAATAAWLLGLAAVTAVLLRPPPPPPPAFIDPSPISRTLLHEPRRG